jgi:TonB family protein
MTKRLILKVAVTVVLAAFAIPVPSGASEEKESACTKPPELIPGPKPSKEEEKKARGLRAQGKVAISIDEEGNVVDATVGRSSSRKAADALLAWAKAMKFKPRPGCGVFKTAVNFTLSD